MKKAFISIAAGLAVIAAFVIFKNIFSCYLPARNRGIQTVIRQGDLELLFLGSSTFRCNIDMPLVDEAYDGRDYDIAYAGNQPVATVPEYEELRAGGNSYGLMVFDLNPMLLSQAVKISDARVIWDLTFPSKLRLWQGMKDSEETDLSTFYEFFVTSGMDDLITYPITEPVYSTRYYKGAKTEETPASSREYLENESFDISKEKVNESQRAAVAALVRRCREDGQRFIFIETPHYYRLADDPKYRQLKSVFVKTLEDEGVDEYILAEDIEMDNRNSEFFEDMTHFSAAGRREYTRLLLEYLKGQSPSSSID